MKKKFILVSLGLALGIGASAAYSLSLKANLIETKALADGFWLCGSFTNPGGAWDHAKSLPMTQESENVYSYDGIYLDRHDDYHFQVFNVTGGSESWTYQCSDTPTVVDGAVDYWGKGWNDTTDACIKFDSGIRVLKITVNVSTKTYTFDWSAPYLTVGETRERMAWNSKEGKYVNTVSGVHSGDEIRIETAGGAVLNNYEVTVGNNVYDDSGTKRIISSGDSTVYFDRTTTSTWVGGYSSNLHNFVTGFLGDTISEGVCADPSGLAKEEINVWSFYKNWHRDFSSSEKAAFQAAVTSVGGGASWHGELEEAAARYVHLLRKYTSLEAFNEVVVSPSKTVLEQTNNQSENAPVIIITICAITLLACVGYITVRKIKEDR